jgi:hypothetical protein
VLSQATDWKRTVDDGNATPPAPDPAGRERFDWLDAENRHLRRDLIDLARAVRADQLRPDDRPVLVERLAALLRTEGLSDRERWRAGRILIALADGPVEKGAALGACLSWRSAGTRG